MQIQTSNTLHNAIMEAGSKDRPPMLAPEWQRFVTLVKQTQELKTVSYHKLYDIMKQHQHEVNEIRAEKIARVANPFALVAQQQLDQEPSMVAEDDETSKDKEIDKLMALIYLSFKKIYKPTNNNLQTSSNTSRANQDNSLRINRSVGYENQRIGNVTGARENVARECQKPKREKDAAYHREKMLLCKQEEAGIQLNAEQADWRDDTDDDELEDQELKAHYMYMAQLQKVSPDAANSGPIFDDEPVQKVSNDDHYNVFAMEKSVHDTYPIEQDAHHVIIDSLDMNYDREEIDQNDDDNDLAKEQAQIKLYKTREDKKLEKVIELENKVKVLDNIVYKTGQSVQTMNMLNNKCRMSFALEFLKKAQRANPRLYDIGCYNDNLALMLAPDSDEVIRLEKESRSKLSDLIRPFDYDKLNNLKDFSKLTSVTQTHVSNDFSKPVTTQTLPSNKKSILKNTSVLAPGMYKIHTDHNQTRTSQLPQNSRKTNKRVSFSTRVIPTTSVSRPQLKSNPQGDRVLRNSSQGKKHEVEDQRRNVKLSKNKTFVTACNDSLNAKTLNVKYISAMCDKCMLIDKHDMCVLNSVAKPIKRIVASESNQKPRNFTRKLYERVSKTCRWWRSIVSNNPLSSNSFVARRDCPIHYRLWVLKAHDGKSQASN
nr:hypothetical protein [Tanacetum cinerariifolium]